MLFFNEWSGGIFKSYATQWDLNSNHILGQIKPIGSLMAIKYLREWGLGTASKLCNCKVLPDIVIYCLFCFGISEIAKIKIEWKFPSCRVG